MSDQPRGGATPEGPILHLIPRADWERFLASGARRYAPASLATEGFVHCTGSDELLVQVANAFYRDLPGELVVLSIDPARLGAEVRWEAPPDADPLAARRFPHVYGPVDLDAVVAVRRLARRLDGTATAIEPAVSDR